MTGEYEWYKLKGRFETFDDFIKIINWSNRFHETTNVKICDMPYHIEAVVGCTVFTFRSKFTVKQILGFPNKPSNTHRFFQTLNTDAAYNGDMINDYDN